MSFDIVTDSPANLPADLIEKYGIHVLNLPIFAGATEYPSYEKGRDSYQMFYDMMLAGQELTSSQTGPAECERVFGGILARGRDLLYLGFSSTLSGTYQNAAIAAADLREKYPERKVLTVDTLSASAAQGLLVLKAADMRGEGRGIEETAAWVEENRLRVCHYFTVDDLKYLRRGGRISGSAAAMGTVLSIKPVLTMDRNGRLVPAGKVRGRKAALNALVEYMREKLDLSAELSASDPPVFIAHADCPDDAAYLEGRIKELYGTPEVRTVMLNPLIGSHTGPGTIALFFFCKER
ncbi:MAG: DegV family protein [Oscillospiraceae bacterium]|nr:DegV family protein [Oscillospiraceae bacterium]